MARAGRVAQFLPSGLWQWAGASEPDKAAALQEEFEAADNLAPAPRTLRDAASSIAENVQKSLFERFSSIKAAFFARKALAVDVRVGDCLLKRRTYRPRSPLSGTDFEK